MKRLWLILIPVMQLLPQLSQAQPTAIDMGLSVKWASCNVGASSPSEYGDFYAWGETSAKSDYSWGTYKWCRGSEKALTKYNTNSRCGTVDGKVRLDVSDDVARQKWGGKWRIPTDAEWKELRENCTWTWTTLNGKKGYKVISKKNGNSIFLPAAGQRGGILYRNVGSVGVYWSSSLCADTPGVAWYVTLYSDSVSRGGSFRFGGLSVRPVRD